MNVWVSISDDTKVLAISCEFTNFGYNWEVSYLLSEYELSLFFIMKVFYQFFLLIDEEASCPTLISYFLLRTSCGGHNIMLTVWRVGSLIFYPQRMNWVEEFSDKWEQQLWNEIFKIFLPLWAHLYLGLHSTVLHFRFKSDLFFPVMKNQKKMYKASKLKYFVC